MLRSNTFTVPSWLRSAEVSVVFQRESRMERSKTLMELSPLMSPGLVLGEGVGEGVGVTLTVAVGVGAVAQLSPVPVGTQAVSVVKMRRSTWTLGLEPARTTV